MVLSDTNVKQIYIAAALIIILVVVLIARATYKSKARYFANEEISVRTSKGIIRMHDKAVAEELEKLYAELMRHSGFDRTAKFDPQIRLVRAHIVEFTERNPHKPNVSAALKKAEICNLATGDTIQPCVDQHLAHATTDSDPDSKPDEFTELLKQLNIAIQMLNNGVCDGGLIDVDSIGCLLRDLDADVNNAGVIIQPESDIRPRHTSHDPYVVPRLSLFDSRQSQLEGFSVETQFGREPPIGIDKATLGPQNTRNAQQRSQLYRENRDILGTTQYIDEDLLQRPTYAEMAL